MSWFKKIELIDVCYHLFMPCQPIKKINQYPIHVQATMIPFQRKDQTSVPFWNKLKYLFRNISLITFSGAESCYLYVNEISLNCHRIPEAE